MPQFNDTELTAAVIRSFEETPDPRVKFLMEELVKSLHDYVRKTDLTFDEWGYAIDFLTRTGQKCTSSRQEFILLSDVLGVSMLVDAVNHRERDGATETTVLGPFFFRTILPCSYPIPTDGPVGEMILQTRRHPMRPAHVHFLVNAPGYEPLITHVFIEGDKYLDSDVVFGVKSDLICKVEKRNDPLMPDGKPATGPWHLMTYDFRLKSGAGTAPKPMMAEPEAA